MAAELLTQHGGGQRGLYDGQRGVVGLVQDVDLAVLQQVLGQDALETLQDPHPLLLLHFALGQHQQRHGGQLRYQLRRRHLPGAQRRVRQHGGPEVEPGAGGVSYPEDAGDVLPGGVDHV